MLRRFSSFSAAALAFGTLLAGGCNDKDTIPKDDAGSPIDPLSYTVKEPGPFSCGHRVVDLTYSLPAGLGDRTVPVHIWYPSEATEGEHPKYRGLFEDSLAWDDVPLAPSPWKAGFPLLVHSHGHKGFAGNSARMMCHFASHGWVAAAPEHVGNTIGDTPDVRPLALYFERPLDISRTVDWMATPPDGDPLGGKVDLERVAMSGHSFGTYTAWAVAGATFDLASIQAACDAGEVADCTADQLAVFETDLSEPRAKVVIPMAGGASSFFGAAGLDSASVPVLLMTGSLDNVGALSLFDSVSGVDLTWVDVEGGCHQLFGLGNNEVAAPECADLPDEEGFAIVNPFALAYARNRILGDDSAEVMGIAEGTASLSPRVSYKHKGP